MPCGVVSTFLIFENPKTILPSFLIYHFSFLAISILRIDIKIQGFLIRENRCLLRFFAT